MNNVSPQDNKISIEQYKALKNEYSNFVYKISHDLSAPVRHTRELVKLLLESLDNDITEEQSEYVTLINYSVNKIESMMDGLLAYSRLTTDNHEFFKFDLNQVITDLIRDTYLNDQNVSIQVHSHPVPSILGSEKLLTAVVSNLLENAVKFRTSDIKTEIVISTYVENNNVIFSIKDNGIGINEKSKDSIFGVFKRSCKDEIPGVGIGLALCKKIIDLHNGNIWAQPNAELGATFYFSIPIN